ncbi:MAG: thiopurine S-methyltransferase [Pseudomonadota bacterium]|nr:thiopurine S-methyltransferase [Pseudomonadota bacterium]
MNPDFWHQRWQQNRIGFHQSEVTPLLQKHWPSLELAPGTRVFVPLSGKTLDMPWLAARGHRVLGVELSQLAIERFFAEHRLQPDVRESRYGVHYRAGKIELICGDVFALDRDALADCSAVYDRAALIALPAELRRPYAQQLYAALPRGCRALMITLEYPQDQKAGPPFSVREDEMRALYSPDWRVETIERRNILANQPQFAEEGVTELDTVVYRLGRR